MPDSKSEGESSILSAPIIQRQNLEIYVKPSLFYVPPEEPQSFWCRHCDMNMVDSDEPSSGLFFYHIGHLCKGTLQVKSGDKRISDDVAMVVFALCYPCIKLFSFEIEDVVLDGKKTE